MIQTVESTDTQAWAILLAPYESDGVFLSLVIYCYTPPPL